MRPRRARNKWPPRPKKSLPQPRKALNKSAPPQKRARKEPKRRSRAKNRHRPRKRPLPKKIAARLLLAAHRVQILHKGCDRAVQSLNFRIGGLDQIIFIGRMRTRPVPQAKVAGGQAQRRIG